MRDPLDSQIAIRIFGYRWVEWNHALLRGAPIDTPGRFLASPDHALAHLHMAAASGTTPAPDPLGLVPPFSTSLDFAFDAAEKVGLFEAGAAVLSRTADGEWSIEASTAGLRIMGRQLAAAVCRAAIAWLDQPDTAESA